MGFVVVGCGRSTTTSEAVMPCELEVVDEPAIRIVKDPVDRGCVAPLPDGAYLVREAVGEVRRGELVDLDGDGIAERWATAHGYCNMGGNCVHALVDGTTCRLLGLFGAEPRALTDGKWPELEAVEQLLGTTMEVRYRFDGKRYVMTRKRVCYTTNESSCRECRPWERLHDRPYPTTRLPGLAPHRYAERCDPPE
ncbi:MAG: hypothetical protein KIT31_09185 [Deltaproteobacteria bacterium]|nr:hypothetical protein [Deltaproteobacteria bacterium]